MLPIRNSVRISGTGRIRQLSKGAVATAHTNPQTRSYPNKPTLQQP